jgi:MinD-like ATPase involved in chromosome partitioning or flagellar assembly
MYVITFYSFKGGVGRTMALANVALSLARRGRRVLLVDFDLEAPGLDTFPLLRPKTPTKGMVDFVTEYCATGVAPDFSDYNYQVEFESQGGALFVMPTGLQGDEYGNRLNSIDWQELYAERNGYLLFEDLKAQWDRTLQPDYVLIDSRTGHTDVGGICTRQLPDAVALLFFPNEQNERGLKTVVEEIRAGNQRSGRKTDICFVASNVPDLDDEEQILVKRLKHFQEALRFEDFHTINHYNSLSLLDQTIFTVERPKSRLASPYRRLVQLVTGENFSDRDVALTFINHLMRGRFVSDSPIEIESSLRKIRSLYPEDGEVLYNLALANRLLGRDEVGDLLIREAQRFGYETEETLVARAVPAYEAGQVELGRILIREALDKPRSRRFSREKVVKAVVNHDPSYLLELVAILSKTEPDPGVRLMIAGQMLLSVEGAAAAEILLRDLFERADEELAVSIANNLVLSLLAQRKFVAAMGLISAQRDHLSTTDIPDNFNYAMGEWGATRTIPRDLFVRVVDAPSPRRDANNFQCRALARWALGDSEGALRDCAAALKYLDETDITFSCWRYLQVDADGFREDIGAFEQLIRTGEGLPPIIAGPVPKS